MTSTYSTTQNQTETELRRKLDAAREEILKLHLQIAHLEAHKLTLELEIRKLTQAIAGRPITKWPEEANERQTPK